MRLSRDLSDKELRAELAALQKMYEKRLVDAEETPCRATMGDMDAQLTRYFDLRSEQLQRRGGDRYSPAVVRARSTPMPTQSGG
jgi:hypothetical protein